jgi:nucleotide sugar dehydrogenase
MLENKDILNLDIEQFKKNLENKTIKVSVIGLGRIGLPTAVAMARVGLKTIGVDINKNIIEFVNQGKLRINDEPGLEKELQKVIIDKKFYAITKIDETIKNTDVIIVCLPTPLENNSKKTNYGFLLEGCSQIACILKKRTLVIIESTVGPGIVENEIIPVLEKESGLKVGKDFLLASCPERANPSTILTDFNKIPRVVGGVNELSTQLAAKLYRFVFNIDVVTVKNCKTANAVKVVENVFRDVNVAFINEIAIFCDRIGIDVKELIEGCKTKYNFIPHFPGPGVGGPCLPVNPYQLLDAPESENILEMVKMARKVNSNMPNYVIELVKDALKETNKIIENVTIGILGISYKPNVGDIQLTPIEDIIKKLEQYKTKIKIFDPYFIGKTVFGIKLESNVENLIKNTDVIILGTDHDEFLNINFRNWKDLMNSSGIIIDTRGKISPSNIRNEGFIFRSIGRTS